MGAQRAGSKSGAASSGPNGPVLARAAAIEAEHLADILNAAMDAVVTVDAEQKIVLFNAAAEQMFRCPAARALGQSLDIFIPPVLREVHRRHVERFDKEGVTTRQMGHLRPLSAMRADGEEFPIEASISSASVGGRKLFTAIIRDVGPRIRAEQALHQAQARFRAIFEHAGLGIAMTDSRGVFLEINAALEKMLGYADAELRGLECVRITHPGDVKATLEHFQALAAGSLESYETEKRYLTKEGKRVWGRVICSAVRDGQGKVQYFVKMIEDITARKARDKTRRREKAYRTEQQVKLDTLTPREVEVLWKVVAGEASKTIALELGASPKTIEVHRARIMEKMQAGSIAELVQMVLPFKPASPQAAERQAPAGPRKRPK